MTRAAATLLLLALSACDAAHRPPAPPEVCSGGWHVCRGQLRDPDGRAVILRGVNLSGEHKNAPYFSFHQPPDYARVRTDWGMNAIRFLIEWAAVEPEPGVYDDAYLDQVAMRMDWAADAGLLVILDMHQDVYGEGFGYNGAPRWTCDQAEYDAFVPGTFWSLDYQNPHVIACFDHLWSDAELGARHAAAWRHVAERLADKPAIIGFDPINEPHWGSYPTLSFEADRLEPYYERIVGEVRAAAPGWVAFLEPASSRNLGLPTSLTPFPFPDVVYAPHAYDSQAEQGMGFDPTHRARFLDHFASVRAEADTLGAALWIGEYGGTSSSPGIGQYMDAAYDGAAAAFASSMYWDYSKGGYGLVDDADQEVTALTDVLVRPYPERIAGDPLSWSYDETTRVLRIEYKADATITAPTQLVAPPRVYPDGVVVECGGCAVVTDGQVIRLMSAPPGDPAVVTLSPATP